MTYKGCYALTENSLRLLEGSTSHLTDNPLFRSFPVEKCGDAVYKSNYKMFGIIIGFCISGSNSSSDYLTNEGFACQNGNGGFYYDPLNYYIYYYMDVYEITE